jgi:hypothetical protein
MFFLAAKSCALSKSNIGSPGANLSVCVTPQIEAEAAR